MENKIPHCWNSSKIKSIYFLNRNEAKSIPLTHTWMTAQHNIDENVQCVGNVANFSWTRLCDVRVYELEAILI